MKVISLAACVSLGLVLGGAAAYAGQDAGYWQYPAIQGYGRIHPRPKAAEQPSRHRIYKVVFDVTKGAPKATGPNPGLDHVARAVNVFASAGVPLKHMHFVAVIHGPAADSVLTAEAYKKKFNADNPNLKLISALHKAGVTLEVCGQSLADNGYQDSQVNPQVRITLSALADLALWGQRGYTLEQQ